MPAALRGGEIREANKKSRESRLFHFDWDDWFSLRNVKSKLQGELLFVCCGSALDDWLRLFAVLLVLDGG